MFLLPICFSTAARAAASNKFLVCFSLSLSSLACFWLRARSAGGIGSRGLLREWLRGARFAGSHEEALPLQQARAPRSILCCPLTSEGNAADRLSKGTQAHQQIKHTQTAPSFSPEAIARHADRTQAKVTIDPSRNAEHLETVLQNLVVLSSKLI